MKKVLIIISVFIALIVASLFIIPIFFKNEINAKIKEEANKNLNAKFDFKDFDLSLFSSFPNFEATLNGLTIIGVDDFKNDTLVNIEELNLTIDLMSVFNGNYSINIIELIKPNINLIVLENGKANWDIAKATETDTTKTQEPSAFKLELKKLIVSNANINYRDDELNFKTNLYNTDIDLKGDLSLSQTKIVTTLKSKNFTMEYEGMKYIKEAVAEVTSAIEADLDKFVFTFSDNLIKINELYLTADGSFSMLDNGYGMDIKYKAKENSFKNFLSMIPAVYMKDFESVKTAGKLSIDGFVKGEYNDKDMPAFGVDLVVKDAMFKYPDLPKSVDNINITANINSPNSDLNNLTVKTKFFAKVAQNPIDIDLFLKTLMTDPFIKTKILGKVDLNSLSDIIPLEKGESINGKIDADINLEGNLSAIENEKYQDFKAEGKFIIMDMNYKSVSLDDNIKIAALDLNFKPEKVVLNNFDAVIGKNDIKANGNIDNLLSYVLSDAKLIGKFNMSSNYFNLNDFMTEDETASTTETAQETEMSVIEVPENIDFELTSTFNKIIYDNLDITNVKGLLTVRDKKVTLNNLTMNVIGGSVGMNGYYSTVNIKEPEYDFVFDIKDFNIKTTVEKFNTIEKLAPIAKNVTGYFSANMKMNGKLDSKMEPVLNKINGGGTISTKNIIVTNSKSISKIADELKMEKLKTITVNDMNLSVKIVDGKVVVEPFDIKIGDVKAKIGGEQYVDQTINYLLTTEIPKASFIGKAESVLNSKLNKNKVELGNTIPINAKITGTITDPKVSLDLKQGVNNAVDDLKQKAKDELDKKKAELEQKAKQEVDKKRAEAEKKLQEEKAKAQQEIDKQKQKVQQEADKKKKKHKKIN